LLAAWGGLVLLEKTGIAMRGVPDPRDAFVSVAGIALPEDFIRKTEGQKHSSTHHLKTEVRLGPIRSERQAEIVANFLEITQ
jgi:hypothetical protein